ncbi:unnamed protein product [Blepharisma stoltei]|uniref:Ubiquitin-activating enzyme E1 n=1 Tax=Blepharisma stoltei TaxID=1481888 RepID=A0AAU9K6F2_9CILI|nr:unnamed protein product [Blepharisma stoltei]
MNTDLNRYSRQIITHGLETQQKIFGLKVLISGLRGLGVEVAKNLLMTGVSTITLHDDTKITLNDLSSNFLIKESDIGGNRAEAIITKLSNYHPQAKLAIHKGNLTKEIIWNHDIVFISESDLNTLRNIDNICREISPQVGFVSGEAWGASGHIFVDFGNNFLVREKYEKKSHAFSIANISWSNPCKITLSSNVKKSTLRNGDFVVFKDIEGMDHLNDGKPRKIKKQSYLTFTIDEDTSQYPAYQGYGIVEPFSVETEVSFKSLSESIDFINCEDIARVGWDEERAQQLNLAYIAIRKFQEIHNELPEINNKNHINECLAFAYELKNLSTYTFENVDQDIICKVAKYARCSISPIVSILGGTAAQEIIKFTGKWSPIHQWWHIDFFDVLKPDHENPAFSRYHDTEYMIGKETSTKLSSLNLFLVGAGSVGNEFLKNCALLGISCGDNGHITISDDDSIEWSNLSNHTLFNEFDVGKLKAATIERKTKEINSDIKLDLKNWKVTEKTEEYFNDEFWENQDIVVAAVDSTESRLSVDSKCLWYKRPVIMNRVHGIEVYSKTILPYLTIPYNDHPHKEESIPNEFLIKYSPHSINNCIEWAKLKVINLFINLPREFNEMQSSLIYDEQKQEQFDFLQKISKFSTYDECVLEARKNFHDIINGEINELLAAYPSDSEGFRELHLRRKISPCEFNIDDEEHIEYIINFSNLLAFTVGLDQNHDKNYTRQILCNYDSLAIENDISDPQQKLLNFSSIDNNEGCNLYIDLIHSMSTIRAKMFKINKIHKIETRMKILRTEASIITSTSLIAGIVSIELIKYVQGLGYEGAYDSISNLSSSIMWLIKPTPSTIYGTVPLDENTNSPVCIYNDKFNRWDNINIEGVLNLEDFIKILIEKHDVFPVKLLYKGVEFYNSNLIIEENQLIPVQELIEKLCNVDISLKKSLEIELKGKTLDGKDLITPTIKYKFK